MNQLSNQPQDSQYTNGIELKWPKVQYCLRYPNRQQYSEFLDNISSTIRHELDRTLFRTVRAGLIEGKSHDDLRAEIAPLITGYPLSESQAYVGQMIARVTIWLRNEKSTPKSANKRQRNTQRSRRTYSKPPAASSASPPMGQGSPRLQLIRSIARQQDQSL